MESSRNDKIDDISEQLIKLLKEHDENHWSVIIESIRNEYMITDNKPNSAQQFIYIMRGGMGSFLDLILHKDRKPLIKENNQLDELRHKLYKECKKIVS